MQVVFLSSPPQHAIPGTNRTPDGVWTDDPLGDEARDGHAGRPGLRWREWLWVAFVASSLLGLGERCRVLAGHDVVCDGATIAAVAPHDPSRPAARTLDATGTVVLPGLINAHTHFYSAFARGLGKAAPSADFRGVRRVGKINNQGPGDIGAGQQVRRGRGNEGVIARQANGPGPDIGSVTAQQRRGGRMGDAEDQ